MRRDTIDRKDIEIVAINDLLTIDHLAYLLKYDSVHGKFKGSVRIEDNELVVNENRIRITAERNPEDIGWGKHNVDYVVESTGFFTAKHEADKHLLAGAKKVIISAPSDKAPMFVMGVNHTDLKKSDHVISNASCTTNCLAPIVKVLHEKFGLEEGIMTTVHAATSTQLVVDGPLKKWRRGRSALNNIIPTSTGAATAVCKIMP